MPHFKIIIDGRELEASANETILSAARRGAINIPTLCYLEKCGALNSCGVCLVKVKGKLVPACGVKVEPGMVVESETVEVHEARRTALELIFSDHVGDCLSPCHRLCPLRMSIPVMLRQVQAGRMQDAIVTVKEALPLPGILGRLCHHPCEQGCRRANWDDPAAIRNVELLVANEDMAAPEAWLPRRKPRTGKSVAIIGSGPAGLTAAFHLLRQGHACTIVDRHLVAGGSLRVEVEKQTLPRSVLEAEIRQFEKLGAQFKLGVTLGVDLTIEGLLRGFDAVLLALGEISKTEGETMGFEMAGAGIKVDLETSQTRQAAVFGAGRAVRNISHLVRAMSDGLGAAECIDAHLQGKDVRRREKPFSSIMGKLEKDELEVFVREANTIGTVQPCDLCSGFSKREASLEASRCLHCDCRSSGKCALQKYAQLYNADAGRFRQVRRKFEQQAQPQGIIFEPGKCILCGICVKLTEMAREPLGLTFIGRGFDVRISAPFGRSIQDGLQTVARECVENCPTGALAFKNPLVDTEH